MINKPLPVRHSPKFSLRKNFFYAGNVLKNDKKCITRSLHLTALPGGRQVFRWPTCPRLPVGRHGRRAGADRRSIVAGELGRYINSMKG